MGINGYLGRAQTQLLHVPEGEDYKSPQQREERVACFQALVSVLIPNPHPDDLSV